MSFEKFCAAPFKTALIDKDGSLKPCCEYMPTESQPVHFVSDFKQWWSKGLEDLRNNVSNATLDPGCHHCARKEENSAYYSHRQYITEKHGTDSNLTLKEIEIRFGNYCNLRCIMCGSYASSSIAQEYREHQDAYQSIGMIVPYEQTVRWWDNPNSIKELISALSTVSTVSFSGGEPLLVPETVDILNSIDSNKTIRFNTNLTRLNQNILSALEKFNCVELMVSLEGTDAHNDYIRYGSEWAQIDQNILTLQSYKNIQLSITHVLQHTSLYSLPNLIDYAEGKNIPLNLTEIYYGSYPSPGVLTINSAEEKIVDRFSYWLSEYRGPYKLLLNNWVNSYDYDQELSVKFRQYISMLDSIRQTNFNSIF